MKLIKKPVFALGVGIALLAPLLAPLTAWAASAGGALQSANNDVANVASLQRGARNFVNYCMACHSARYVQIGRAHV